MTFVPWSQPVYPAPQPYRPQPVRQAVAATPRPAPPAVSPTRPVAARVPAPSPAFKPLVVPPPEQLGVTLEPRPASVAVPEPEKLGIVLR